MIDKFFRTSFSEQIFNYKYKHENAETWDQLSATLIEDVCRETLTYSEKQELIKLHTEMKFIAGGRYLYYAGKKNKFFNNCLGGETKVLTDKGYIVLKDNINEKINILSPVDGKFYESTILSHGVQQLRKITFNNLKGRKTHEWTVRATRTHHWMLKDGSDTYDLKVGDVVPANNNGFSFNLDGFIHGFVFGDGTSKGQLRLCADKGKKYLDLLSSGGATVTYPKFANGDPLLYFGYKKTDWKNVPDKTADPSYISSFIQGWLKADGNETTASFKLNSIRKDVIEWFREHASYAGIVITGNIRSQKRNITLKGNVYNQHEIYIQSYAYGSTFPGFKVVKIEEEKEEEVFCPFEPIHNRIVIDHGIDTFNCYLLRSEEDSRQDWAMLSWKAESCLTTGGGIGNDYTIYRGEGTPVKRTGGVASGPISKAKMINEIGREVMQGGSRRSAIYGSLNWQHSDAGKWLTAKDWYNMPVKGAFNEKGEQMTIGLLKEQDFNYPAPLDMTNISLNYDNAFLEQVYGLSIEEIKADYRAGVPLKIKNIPEMFRENCLQALKSGEPGFSFNFFEKENETLRNACTEVTSEDDSDVCNLGSVNMARIETIEEFGRVCYLGSRMLLCGTLIAQLPYQKVADVREKNRRLGLGLMGVHEWLLKRGYRYEVVPELHKWLRVYQEQSERGANELADALGINRPIAYRAIAPTGTIGILAGTTTGIEPLFAVAYKRRYLKNGKEWVYQYVIDGTAKILIDQFEVDPYKIETALSLADDYERRIKFQADVQDYVDMSISSTINIPKWATRFNNIQRLDHFAHTLAKYAHRLRGFTCYPDGSRGGQPLTIVDYYEAKENEGKEFQEQFHDICDIQNRGGTCGA